jgi:hypothetical protein
LAPGRLADLLAAHSRARWWDHLDRRHSPIPTSSHAQFVALTRDVVRGAELCFQVVHNELLDRDAGQDTLFNIQQIENLTFLAAPLAADARRQSGAHHRSEERRCRMSAPINTTASQRPQRPAMSILPAGHFARAGGAEPSPVERQLLEDFRQLDGSSRATMASVVHKAALREREHRVVSNVAGLRLVGGGAP